MHASLASDDPIGSFSEDHRTEAKTTTAHRKKVTRSVVIKTTECCCGVPVRSMRLLIQKLICIRRTMMDSSFVKEHAKDGFMFGILQCSLDSFITTQLANRCMGYDALYLNRTSGPNFPR